MYYMNVQDYATSCIETGLCHDGSLRVMDSAVILLSSFLIPTPSHIQASLGRSSYILVALTSINSIRL